MSEQDQPLIPARSPVMQEMELSEESMAGEAKTLDPAASVVEEPHPADLPADPVAEEAAEEAKETPAEPQVTKQSVLIEFNYDHSTRVASTDTITMPSGSEETVRKMVEGLPNISLTDSEQGREWVATVRDSLNKSTYDGMLGNALEREGSDWRQYVDHNNNALSGGYPKYPASQGGTLSGSQSVVRMLNHLGLGNLFNAPMWHSGFWVTFRPPSESALVDLNHLLASDKISFGRLTYGLVYSNLSAYTTDRLVRFALDHVYETTVRPEDLTARPLLTLLKSQDIPMFLHGFLCATYPRGFNYRRSCIAEPSKCNHVAEETLNLRYLNIVDNSELTAVQKNHMSKRTRHSMDLKSVDRYQEEMTRLHPRKVDIPQANGLSISVVLKAPSFQEHIQAGHRWIDAMVEMVEETMGKDVGTTERNSLLQQHGLATILCQYSHWVSEIHFSENEIVDRESVDTNLAHLSSDDEMRTAILEAIKSYINDTTVALVGIPTYDCPKCKKAQNPLKEGKPIHTEVIPLDLIQVFFSLVRQRIARLTRR